MEKVKAIFTSLVFITTAYIILTLIAAQLLCFAVNWWIDQRMMELMSPRPDQLVMANGVAVSLYMTEDSIENMIVPENPVQNENEQAFHRLQLFRMWMPLGNYTLCFVLYGVLYYQFKTKKSMNMLSLGIRKIRERNLDFTFEKPSKDELGQLCQAFETMRAELAETFEALWESELRRRTMYRAFAHDLRTPLTIIKGNHEMIREAAEASHDWERVLHSVNVSERAVERMVKYADQVQALEQLDEIVPEPCNVSLGVFVAELRMQLELSSRQADKRFELLASGCEGEVMFDRLLLQRVFDNVAANALRFATSCVTVEIIRIDHMLTFQVKDDGPGFSMQALQRATDAFFTTSQHQGHIGIGLSVCKQLITKLGGALLWKNVDGGGQVICSIPI